LGGEGRVRNGLAFFYSSPGKQNPFSRPLALEAAEFAEKETRYQDTGIRNHEPDSRNLVPESSIFFFSAAPAGSARENGLCCSAFSIFVDAAKSRIVY
jgi:hypothetical protein